MSGAPPGGGLATSVAALPGCENRGAALNPPSDAPILLFAGAGTSAEDVATVETILREIHLGYSLVSTSQLNAMTEPELRSYQLLIVPGGNFLKIGRNVEPSAIMRIHDAVQSGLGYLGICAGAFLAGRSTHYASLDLADVQFGFYADLPRSQGCRGDRRPWDTDARAVLGGRPAAWRLGRGDRQVP